MLHTSIFKNKNMIILKNNIFDLCLEREFNVFRDSVQRIVDSREYSY